MVRERWTPIVREIRGSSGSRSPASRTDVLAAVREGGAKADFVPL